MKQITASENERALEIYGKSIVVNTNDSTKYYAWPVYFPRLYQGGITSSFVTVVHPTGEGLPPPIYEATFRIVAHWVDFWNKLLLSLGPDKVQRATTVKDIKKAKKEKKIAPVYMLQGANSIEELGLVNTLFQMGIRIMGLTYMRRNYIGDGCMERNPSGLSKYGIQVVEEMNKVGIVVDLSHVGYRTTMDAIETSKNPCTFSHSNPMALREAVRNATDDQIQALAAKGGVMGITSPWWFLPTSYGKRPEVDDYLDAMEYVIKLVGIDHVAIGLDISAPEGRRKEDVKQLNAYFPDLTEASGGKFDVWPVKRRYANGLDAHTALPIAKGLVVRGYSDQDIQKVLGLNWLRVFEKVWGE
ncbi:MAG: dipeptidase [Thaumarchaeota archaeon]|nr:dipeptidase [Nitrososphaerota archaeon]